MDLATWKIITGHVMRLAKSGGEPLALTSTVLDQGVNRREVSCLIVDSSDVESSAT
jgi:hypothetical protein